MPGRESSWESQLIGSLTTLLTVLINLTVASSASKFSLNSVQEEQLVKITGKTQ